MKLVRSVAVGALLVARPVTPVAAADAPATLSVDLATTRPAISKYVYGQFIEHLGRSIYGGLWAEILRIGSSSTRSTARPRPGPCSPRASPPGKAKAIPTSCWCGRPG